MNDMIWINKRVYVKIKNSNRAYSGIVLDEDEVSITLRDIKNHLVRLSKSDLSILQEEVLNGRPNGA